MLVGGTTILGAWQTGCSCPQKQQQPPTAVVRLTKGVGHAGLVSQTTITVRLFCYRLNLNR